MADDDVLPDLLVGGAMECSPSAARESWPAYTSPDTRSRYHERPAPYLAWFGRELIRVVVPQRLLEHRAGELSRIFAQEWNAP